MDQSLQYVSGGAGVGGDRAGSRHARGGSDSTFGPKGRAVIASALDGKGARSDAGSIDDHSGTPSPALFREGRPAVLEVRDLEKTYGGGRSQATRALSGVSLSIAPGETVAIMGPSGSGKTTLLNCIATIDRPTAGSVWVDGLDVTRLPAKRLAEFRRSKLGFVFQESNLLDTLTCEENIALALTIERVRAAEIPSRVHGAAAALGVAEVLGRYPYQVSGGQAQRVACARAIVGDPSLVLADEPTGALDSRAAKLLLECLERLNAERGATICMVTHDSFAASYCQRVLFIRDGRLFAELRRGEQPRRRFFEKIMAQVAQIGGGEADVL